MAEKKPNEDNTTQLSKRSVFHLENGVTMLDAFGLDERVARLSAVMFSYASRLLSGFVVQAITIEGNLERLAGESGRNFVLDFEFKVQLAPFTKKAIDECAVVVSSTQQELQQDEVRPSGVAVSDG